MPDRILSGLPVRAVLPAVLLVLAQAGAAHAESWTVRRVTTPGPVAEIVRTGPARTVLRIGTRWYRAVSCADGTSLAPARAPGRRRPPAGGLADGWVARGGSASVAKAWYAEPTRRYDHGILGDRVEAGALVATGPDGRRHTLRLPPTEVFEDLAPRLADIDGDGRVDIVTIRSSLARGASVAVYRLTREGLDLLDATPPIGRTHRWLNIATIADFDRDGRPDIALVGTPHIGGTLEIWSWRSGRLVRRASQPGYSNHAIGSRHLDLSAVMDIDGDGRPELALPDARRRALAIVGIRGSAIETRARIPLPGRIAHNIGTCPGGFLVGLDSGALVSVSR